MAAIDRQNLWDLARRPLDLIWLADFWKQHGQFGLFHEMLEASISERLKETNPVYSRTDPIAHREAMAVAERIGAALVFGRKDRLLTLNRPIKAEAATDAFAIEDIAPDLSSQRRQRLVLRPIFDPATFDRIRLHNDNEGNVRSYLASRWLRRRRASNGCSLRELFDLLFADTYEIKTIIPSARQTAAWLSIWDDDVAREVIKRDPYLLLSSGDPASLPLAVRQDALRGTVKQMCAPGWYFRLFDHDSLRRLATADMVPIIIELYALHCQNAEVRHLLLAMIDLGNLDQCANVAFEATFDASADSTTRVFGARAFVKFASKVERIALGEYLQRNAGVLPGIMLWETTDRLFPDDISLKTLMAIIDRLPDERREGFLDFYYYGPKFIQRIAKPADIETLIAWLLVKIGPVTCNHGQATEEERSYRPALQAAALALLQKVDVTLAPELAINAALRIGANRLYRNDQTEPKDLTLELHRSSTRKRAAFWRAVDYFPENALTSRSVSSIVQMRMLGWTPGIAVVDLDWLLVDIKEQPTVDRRALAAHAVLDLWIQSDRNTDILARLKIGCIGVDNLSRIIREWETPPPPSAMEVAQAREHARMRAAYDIEQSKRDASWIEFIHRIKADPDALRNLPKLQGDRVDPRLFYLWEILSSQSSNASHYAIDDPSALVPIVGQDVTDALADGLIAFWRQRDPMLVSERDPDKRNIVQKFDCMAIVGVTLEAKRDSRWADKLTPEEATKATKLATLELNGFPTWTLDLCKKWPKEVSSVLMGEVISEFDGLRGADHGIVHDIAFAPAIVAMTVASDMLWAIQQRSGLRAKILSPALNTVVIGADITIKASLAPLALNRFAFGHPEDEATATYLAAAFRVDPVNAITAMTAKLDELGPEDQTKLVKTILPRVFSGWAMRDDGPQVMLPVDVLVRLIVIAFSTVKVEEDNVRVNGEAFYPDARDDAERAREGAFEQLLGVSGPAAFAALKRLSQLPAFAGSPGRMRELLLRRAALDSEHEPWRAGEAAALEETFDTAPQTPRDLQRVAMRRIYDINHDLHHADFAQGVTLKRLQNEREVQVWVANEFRNRKGRAYTGEREPHVVEEKEPDIRLQASGSDASLPIEIKVAESWSLLDLERALETQLGGRYLRAKDARHGILLLVHKEHHTWNGPAGEKWKLADVVKHLRAIADVVASRGQGEPRAMIGVIDVADVAFQPSKSTKTRAAKQRSVRKLANPAKSRKSS